MENELRNARNCPANPPERKRQEPAQALGNHLVTLSMAYDLLTTRRRRKLVFGVLVVGIIASALVAMALFYMSQASVRF